MKLSLASGVIAISIVLISLGAIGWWFFWVKPVLIPDSEHHHFTREDGGPLIQHLACIMDGNRRWAKKKGLVPWYGHKEGVESVHRTIEFCLEQHIRYLSLYTFSLENFRRSPQETQYLFELMIEQAKEAVQTSQKQGIQLRFIGDRSKFPERLVTVIDDIERQTKSGNALTVNFLFCYGAQQELVHAIKDIAREVQEHTLTIDAIDIALIKQHMWLKDIPDPEIIIRTGNVSRLSNFLLFQAAYSELYFLDCLWPDLTKKDLREVLSDFERTQRNFGT